jgi:hypothetical protein
MRNMPEHFGSSHLKGSPMMSKLGLEHLAFNVTRFSFIAGMTPHRKLIIFPEETSMETHARAASSKHPRSNASVTQGLHYGRLI